MKNIKLIFAISTLLISCHNFAQVGVIKPIKTLSTDVASGTYIKDTNNSFAPFIGTWQCVWNGKTITYFISKVTKNLFTYDIGKYYYEDCLIIKYIIIENSTGTEIANTMSITNYSNQKIVNSSTGKNGKILFYYYDNDLCGYGGEIGLRQDPNNPDIMNYGFRFDREFQLPIGCIYPTIQSIPIPIPTVSLVLTRI